MIRVIVHACSQMISIEQAAKRLKNAPKAPVIRFHLGEKLDLAKIERQQIRFFRGLLDPFFQENASNSLWISLNQCDEGNGAGVPELLSALSACFRKTKPESISGREGGI